MLQSFLLFSCDAIRKPRFKACLRKWYLKPLRHVPSSGCAIVRPGIALHAETGWFQSSRIPNLDSQRRRYGDKRKALETRSAVFRNGLGTFSRRIPLFPPRASRWEASPSFRPELRGHPTLHRLTSSATHPRPPLRPLRPGQLVPPAPHLSRRFSYRSQQSLGFFPPPWPSASQPPSLPPWTV